MKGHPNFRRGSVRTIRVQPEALFIYKIFRNPIKWIDGEKTANFECTH